MGFGAYRFQADGIYFSTSDNSDPNLNQRCYRLVYNPLNVFGNSIAVNCRPGRLTDDQINQRVDYAMAVLPIIQQYELITGSTLNGKTVLEVGPGPDYVWTLVMACMGARCSVIDPFVAVWSEQYHPAFYRALEKRLQTVPGIVTTAPIKQLLESHDFDESGVLTRFNVAVEEFEDCHESFDFILSVAVAEHFYDIAAAFKQLTCVTRPGGIGIHIIDLRDHRDFTRPLEYLLMTEDEYLKEFVLRHAECGNRHRAFEFQQLFQQLGLEVVANKSNLEIDQNYLNEFIPRLRSGGHERFRLLESHDLQPAGIAVALRKKGPMLTSESR